MGLTEYPELFAAGADLFGIVNFSTFFQHTEPWMAAISTTEYGDPKTQADLLHSLSPLAKLDRIRVPLMVQHGANDTNVPVVEAEQVVDHEEARCARGVRPLSGRRPRVAKGSKSRDVRHEDGGVLRETLEGWQRDKVIGRTIGHGRAPERASRVA